ncbi:unnamed protein product [Arctogadus glacialis]
MENLNEILPEGPSFGLIEVHHAGTNIITLGLASTEQQVGSQYQLLYSSKIKSQTMQILNSCKVDIVDLLPGTEYTFTIIKIVDGKHTNSESVSVFTEAIPPGNVQVSNVSSSTVSLTWETPAGEVEGYVVTCICDSEKHGEQTTDSDSVTFSDLKPGLNYDFDIKTQLKSGGLSQPVSTSAQTETELEGFLKKLGLKEHCKEKLSLSSVLQIDMKAVTEEAAKCLSDLPWCFLKKLMMVKN